MANGSPRVTVPVLAERLEAHSAALETHIKHWGREVEDSKERRRALHSEVEALDKKIDDKIDEVKSDIKDTSNKVHSRIDQGIRSALVFVWTVAGFVITMLLAGLAFFLKRFIDGAIP